MMFNLASLISVVVLALPLAALAAPATPATAAGLEDRSRSKTHKVTVGKGGKLRYHPEYVKAKVGDYIQFEFHPKNHTVTETWFHDPCYKNDDGFDTGFVPVPEDKHSKFPTKKYKVTDKEPHWFFCRQEGHCLAGMVFAVNPPKTGNTFKKYRDNSIYSEQY
ncbi:hypothetical protein BDV93DRAFT_526052 [Ceratobasidium sp. AG-I]|nr:hypothetical protein BDV93DRAFT_526052 [Ceratobasidium sp. AG-I]